MQHSDQASEFFQRNFLRRELLFKAVSQIVKAALAIEPIEDGEFFFLESEVVQPDRLFDDPELPTLVALLVDDQIGPATNRQRTSGTGNKAVGKRRHGSSNLAISDQPRGWRLHRRGSSLAALSVNRLHAGASRAKLNGHRRIGHSRSQKPLPVFTQIVDFRTAHISSIALNYRFDIHNFSF